MADLARSPIVQESRRHPDHTRGNGVFQPNNLLTTLLVGVVLALPVRNPDSTAWRTVQHPSLNGTINADTTRGTPKTLLAEVILPRGRNTLLQTTTTPEPSRNVVDTSESIPKAYLEDSQFAPSNMTESFVVIEWQGQNINTSVGSSPVLFGITPKPIVPPPFLNAIRYPGSVQDTSKSTPPNFIPATVLAKPVFGYAFVSPPRYWFQPDDASSGIPKVLYGDQIPPVINPPISVLDRIRPVVDTSQSTPAVLIPAPVVVSPAVNAPHFPPVKFWFQPQDTSQGTPKGLYGDQTPPFFNYQHTQPDWQRPVVNTSVGSSVALLLDVPLPFIPAPHFPPVMFWFQPEDSSKSTAKVMYGDQTPPLFNYQHTPPDRVRVVVDSQTMVSYNINVNPPPPIIISSTRIIWG